MAQRRNTGRKLPAKSTAPKQTTEITGDAPEENAADVPAGTDQNMDPDASSDDAVAVNDEAATHDIPGVQPDAPQEVIDAGVAPKQDMENIEIPQERVATRAEEARRSIDPESDVDNPHMDANLNAAVTVPDYEDDMPENDYRESWLKVLKDSGVVPPQGRILFPEEPITYEGFEIDGDVVVLTKDIYRMVLPFRSTRPTFTLLARKGRTVPKNRLLSKSAYEKAVRRLPTHEDA